jgi:hypothetical protein
MKRLTAKLLPALLLLTLILAACLLPPFDRGLSLAQATARKLKLEARIGPLYRYRGDLERGRYYFLPGKTRGLNRGFLVVFGTFEGRVFYIDFDALEGYRIAGDQYFALKNSDENIFNYAAYVLKDSSVVDDALLVVRPTSPIPASEQRLELQYVAGTGWVPHAYDLSAFTSGITGGQVVGVGLFPDVSATTDSLTTLVNEGGTSNYFDRVSNFAFAASGYSLAWAPSAVPGSGIPGDPTQGFYFRNPALTGLRFLSVWNGSGYANYRWDDISPPAALPFDNRIEALLSTNELFILDGEQGMIYTPSGERKYRFPLGDLHFAYETYLGGVPTLLFSLVYWDQVGGDNEEFHINVYSLPTASLSTLD